MDSSNKFIITSIVFTTITTILSTIFILDIYHNHNKHLKKNDNNNNNEELNHKIDISLLKCDSNTTTTTTTTTTTNNNNNNNKTTTTTTYNKSIIPKEYPDEIKNEIYSRVKTFFTEKGFTKLQECFVIVVGLGGVGSHCANMLVRSGIINIRLIDFDLVTLSSLNRHALATISDVGKTKVDTMKRRLLDIVPWCHCDIIPKMFKLEDASILLNDHPTIVIDCIDDVNTKSDLIAYCINNNISIITSMGAGGKSDPTKLRISALSDVINDPLAMKIRWKLKKLNISASQVISIYSVEKPVCDLLPLEEEQKNAPEDYGAVDYMRLRVMPVLGTSPSIFGHALASYVLCTLGDKPYSPEVGERMSKNLKHKVFQVLKKEEKKRFNTESEIDIDDDDLEFIVQQVWRSRCASTNRRFGGHVCLTLTRWNPKLPPTPYNLVLLMQNEAIKLAEIGNELVFNSEIRNKIINRLQWAKQVYENSWNTLDHTGGSSSCKGVDEYGNPLIKLIPYPNTNNMKG